MRSQHQLFTKRMHCVASKFCLQVRNIPLMTVCDIDEQRIFLCERIFCARWRLESQTFISFPTRPESFQETNVLWRLQYQKLLRRLYFRNETLEAHRRKSVSAFIPTYYCNRNLLASRNFPFTFFRGHFTWFNKLKMDQNPLKNALGGRLMNFKWPDNLGNLKHINFHKLPLQTIFLFYIL